MSKKITKKKFIETIENNEDGLTNKELATKLGISEVYFYKLRKKYRNEIRNIATEMCKTLAVEQVQNLRRAARNGSVKAAISILEMAGSYVPSSKKQIQLEGEQLGVIRLPAKKPVGAPVDLENGFDKPSQSG